MAEAAVRVASHRRCERCQGPIEFHPEAGRLKCPYCAAERAIEAAPEVPTHALAEAPALAIAPAGEGLRVVGCANCGAVAELPATTAATRCAFCAAPLPVDARVGVAAPAEGVVPFAIGKKAAEDRFAAWLRGLWFRPGDLRRLARLHLLRGVYVPVWTFDAAAASEWEAEAGFHYWEEETVEVNGRTETKRVQRTRWERRRGRRGERYRDVPVSASRGLKSSELHELQPFAFDRLRRFDPDFLAGFEAERHGTGVDAGWVEAKARLEQLEEQACAAEVPGDTHRNLSVETTLGEVAFRSVLVPAYVAAYEYRAKRFRVVVNGESGRVTGEAPLSWPKVAAFVLLLAALIAFVVLASSQA